MEEKNSCLDVEFIKAYLQSSIELETQKRIAEQTFNELLREENQWKQKMSSTVSDTPSKARTSYVSDV